MRSFDLVVIGAGPGGYVAAIRAAQLGMSVACVEKEPLLGGTCLRVGCIPSKALLESSEVFASARKRMADHGVSVSSVELDLAAMMSRKQSVVQGLGKGIDGLFRKNRIERIQGSGTLLGSGRVAVDEGNGKREELSARHVLVATGSRAASLEGVELDGHSVATSTEALAYEAVPKHLVVIGAGYIGLELGSVWRRLGARVTIVEYLDRILPGMDSELASAAARIFAAQGLELRLKSRVKAAYARGEGARVELEGDELIDCDRVMLAVGRVPNTEGLESSGLAFDERGHVAIGPDFATNLSSVYAIGDVVRGPMLAHKAEEEGVACAESIATGHGHVNYEAIPGVVYTHPEVASVGRTEEDLKREGIEYKRGRFSFAANGRARALGETEGFVKVLADASTDRVLGVHILGPRAGDLIAEGVAAMEFGASSEDLARTCHAHPTLAEAVKEASLAVSARSLHG